MLWAPPDNYRDRALTSSQGKLCFVCQSPGALLLKQSLLALQTKTQSSYPGLFVLSRAHDRVSNSRLRHSTVMKGISCGFYCGRNFYPSKSK
jgi:hypothetical protein